MSGLTVRGAGPGDRDAIQAVTLAAYQEYTATIGAHWEGYRQNIIATARGRGARHPDRRPRG